MIIFSLKEENNDNKEVEKKTESSSEKKAESSSEKKDESSSEEEDFPEPDTTLFIKGLNFSTKEEAIKEVNILLSNFYHTFQYIGLT